ncbi:thioesterase family protein [Sutcliffiella deserti]|uniref:thioesterase family protein n=1 Tax=Sutcliffiella deserti TaxID=2875501 RepID=UPI001CBB68F4|nr:hotdog domain-containing protein [Sutcliffiella deserti]
MMKPGLTVGMKFSMNVKVTKEMFAQFEGEVVHPVYSTAMMVYHMEWVSRQLLLPYLKEEEEGMGAKVTVNHVSPAPEGSMLEIQAKVISCNQNVLKTEVHVNDSEKTVGTGEVTQIVLTKSKISRLISNSSQIREN